MPTFTCIKCGYSTIIKPDFVSQNQMCQGCHMLDNPQYYTKLPSSELLLTHNKVQPPGGGTDPRPRRTFRRGSITLSWTPRHCWLSPRSLVQLPQPLVPLPPPARESPTQDGKHHKRTTSVAPPPQGQQAAPQVPSNQDAPVLPGTSSAWFLRLLLSPGTRAAYKRDGQRTAPLLLHRVKWCNSSTVLLVTSLLPPVVKEEPNILYLGEHGYTAAAPGVEVLDCPPPHHTGKGKSSARRHAGCSQAGQGGNSSRAGSSSISYHSPCCRWGYYLWTGTKRHAKRKDKAMPGLQPLLKGRESRTARLPILGCIRRTVVSLLHLLLCWYNQAKWPR